MQAIVASAQVLGGGIPLPGFTCSFLNPDGSNVYPCASVVTAHIELPTTNQVTKVILLMPNSFHPVNTTGTVSPSGVVAGNAFGISYGANDLYTITFLIASGTTSLDLPFRYFNCNAPGTSGNLNTTALLFDCQGIGNPNTQLYNAEIIPPTTVPGLNVLPLGGTQIAHAIESALPAIQIVTSASANPNNILFEGICGEEYDRFFTVVLNSLAVDQFYMQISVEVNADGVSLHLLNTSGVLNPGGGFSNTTGAANGVGEFFFNISSLPVNCFTTDATTGIRTFNFVQRVALNCLDNTQATVSAKLDCTPPCNSDWSFLQTLILDGVVEGVTPWICTNNFLQNVTPGAASTLACHGDYEYFLDFEVDQNNPLLSDHNISILRSILIPINTNNFSVQGVDIYAENPLAPGAPNWHTIPAIDVTSGPGSITVWLDNPNPAPGQGAGVFQSGTNPNWDGFDYLYGNGFNLPYPNGAWVNTNGFTILHLKVRLMSNFQDQNCPASIIRVTPISANGTPVNVQFSSYRTCIACSPTTAPTTLNAQPPNIISSSALSLSGITCNFDNDIVAGTGSPDPLEMNFSFGIPAQSPFLIANTNNANTQTDCPNYSYQAILNVTSTYSSFSVGTITGLNIYVNGIATPTTWSALSSTQIIIDLPPGSNTPPLLNNYALSFTVDGIPCPDPGTGQGSQTYSIAIVAVCADCGTTNPRVRTLSCLNGLDVMIHCAGICSNFVDTYTGLSLKRSTFGWLNVSDYLNDPLNPSIPDEAAYHTWYQSLAGSTPSYFPYDEQSQLRTLYPYDLLNLHAEGNISPVPSGTGTYTSLVLEINQPGNLQLGNNFYSLHSFEISFTPVINGVPGTPIMLTNADFVAPLNLPSLSIGSSIASPPAPLIGPVFTRELSFNASDLLGLGVDINNTGNTTGFQKYEIVLNAKFRIIADVPIIPEGSYSAPLFMLFKSEAIDANGNPVANGYRSCDPRGDAIIVLIPDVDVEQNSVQTGDLFLPDNNPPNVHVGSTNTSSQSTCKFGHALGIRHSGGNGNQPDFLPEFRPLTAWPHQLPSGGISTVDDFYSGPENYIIPPGMSYYENSLSGATPVPLLPPLARATNANSYQGLVVTMEKECPNSSPWVNIPIDINRYAYIHNGHGLSSSTIPSWPSTITPASFNSNLQAQSPIQCGALLTFTNTQAQPNINSIPNGSFVIVFNLTVPPGAENLPIALKISTPGPNSLGALSTTSGISITTQSGWYVLNNGLPNSNQAYSFQIQVNLGGVPTGCYGSSFDITWESHVFCDPTGTGQQVDDFVNGVNAANPCVSCTETRTFQRGTSSIANLTTTNTYTQNLCDLEWQLTLTNPISEPTIIASNLTLNLTTGLFVQGLPVITIAGVPYTGIINISTTLNTGSGSLSILSPVTTITVNQITLFPGESITYNLVFNLTQGICDQIQLNNGQVSVLSAELQGTNACNESFNIVNINTYSAALPAILMNLSNPAGNCCTQNPITTIIHTCSSITSNGSVTVDNPSVFTGALAVEIILTSLNCIAQPCSTIVTGTQAQLTIANLSAGPYLLNIWDPNTGAFYTQQIVIENHSFTVSIDPTSPAFCDPGSVDLIAIPLPNDPNVPLASFNFTYSWSFNSLPIPGSNTPTYTATAAGNYSLLVTDASGCTAFATTTVVVDPPLSIIGPQMACDINAQYCLPTFVDVGPCMWYVNGIPFATTNTAPHCVNIDWSAYAFFGGTIEVGVPDCGEHNKVITFVVQPCCDSPNMPKLTETDLANILNNPGIGATNSGPNEYTISNATFELENANQFLNCNANLILDHCNIAMNDAHSFRMTSGMNITLINTNIKGCDLRHNGIEATAGGSTITIDNSSNTSGIIQDANTAINVFRGTLISSNGSFDKNVEHIFAQQSTVVINGGNYYSTGNLLPPYVAITLPPFNSPTPNPSITVYPAAMARAVFGIRLLECNPNSDFPHGDGSLPEIFGVDINNASTGLEVRSGGLICKGSLFSNCKKGIYLWNRHYSPLADAECNIGTFGGSSLDANTFTHCTEGIFAGGKLIPCHIDGNNISNSLDGFGIKLQWLKGRGFSIYNNTLDNCRTGIYSYGNACNESNQGIADPKTIRANTLTHDPGNPLFTKAIVVEEATVTANDPALYLHVSENWIEGYRHGLTATNSAFLQVFDNRVYLSPDLAGIWNQAGNLTDYINGVGINYCPKAIIKDNKVSAKETTPYSWATWLTSGFRIDMSPGTTVCSNTASENTHPLTGDPLQIGDPFEFHGNCAPSTFKLNTMNNSTARGLYMGGMPIGGAVNGTIIGDQGATGIPHDNTWSNISGFHTDFNNVFVANNEFYMTYSTNGFNNNAQPPGPSFTFASFQTPGTVSCGGAPFIATPAPGPRELDVFDDIALDSISELGGNDTSRYFGKEFLYNQLKNDSLLASNSIFSLFKDSVESTNAKPIEIIKEGLIFPLDSNFIDTLAITLAQIQPINNIETNFKTLMEIVSINPELKDSVFTNFQFSELRRIAQLCPYTDGSAVYSARVILHQFEPDSNYYNFCEFAKRPDRQSNARTESENKTEKNSVSNIAKISYSILPNPNHGSFMLNCPNDEQVELELINSSGQVMEKGRYKPVNRAVNFELKGIAKGVYFLRILSQDTFGNLKLIIQP